MHYNSRSIALAAETVRAEAEAGTLRCVVVESCPTRWKNTLKVQPAGSFLRGLFDNEMQAAAEVAEEFGCGVSLGDQAVEDTGRRIAQLGGATLVEALTPFAGGWGRIQRDLVAGWAQLDSPDGVSVSTLLEPRLLLATPLALFRYPASIAFKSPALFSVLVGLGALTAGGSDTPLATDPAGLSLDLLQAAAFALLETLFLGRVFLVGLLEERNYVLARNIRRAATAKPEEANWAGASGTRSKAVKGRTVVAVLGMAHLNGVKQILTTSRVV